MSKTLIIGAKTISTSNTHKNITVFEHYLPGYRAFRSLPLDVRKLNLSMTHSILLLSNVLSDMVLVAGPSKIQPKTYKIKKN